MPEWSYDHIAQWYDQDMGLNMPFDDLAGYKRLLPPAPARVLEVGCGTGRLTIPLAQAGYAMTGLDRSVAMLDQFAEKLASSESRLQNGIQLSHQDARSMQFAEWFDAIVFSYCGFQYLIEEEGIHRFCRRAAELLMPDGCLILDIFLHQPQATSNELSLDFERKLHDGSKLSRYKRIELVGRTNRVERIYKWQAAAGAEESPLEREVRTVSRQRLYSASQLTELLRAQGFECTDQLFDYHESPTAESAKFFTGRFVLQSPDVFCLPN